MSIFKTFKQGDAYLKSWPKIKQLNSIFPEHRIIVSTEFAKKFTPFFAAFTICWQQIGAKGDMTSLAVAILTAIFALCLPFQGLYWLGKRSQTPLPYKSAKWFEQMALELKQKYDVRTDFAQTPTYQDLALLLTEAQKKFPPSFWQEI